MLKSFVFLFCFIFAFAKEPLRFLVEPFDNQYKSLYVHLRDTVAISCQTNDPNATVTVQMTVNHASQSIVQNGQNFTLYNVNLHNIGRVTCYAESSNAKIKLELGVLRVNKYACVEHPVIYPNKSIYLYEKNDNFKIICEALGGDESITWSKNNETLNSKVVSQNQHSAQKVLEFSSADESIAGFYTCIRQLYNCKEEQTTRNTIQLQYRQPFQPEINKSTATAHEVNKGLNATLKCVTNGSPPPTLQWYGNKKLLKRCDTGEECDLIIDDVQLSSNYTCVASNTEGSDELSYNLVVLVPPEVSQGSRDSSKGRLLACHVTQGYPKPVIYWQKKLACSDGSMKCPTLWTNISGDVFKIMQSPTSSELEFLDQNIHGTFRCVAVNSAGKGTIQMVLPKNSAGGGITRGAIVGIILSFLAIFLIFICVILSYRKYMNKKYAPYMHPDPTFQLDPDRTLFQQSIELPYQPEWEFPRDRLDHIKSLGSGAFGQVWLAHARGILALSPRDKDSIAIRRRTRLRMNKKIPKSLINCFLDDDLCEQNIFVAVKTLKSNASDVEYKDLASEIKVLIHIGSHENIVNLLGACTKDGSLCAIIEFCPYGNLVNFLRERRDIFSLQWARQGDNYDEDFCFLDATHVAYQIACGMQFLAEKKLVHRDLAARNVLVGNDFVIKIADFGLTRDIEKTEFYLKESSGMLPVKWMAPESLFDKLYTIKSDVWSFGIVLWEISTMGGSPYPGLPMENLFDYLRVGNRMQKPETCPDELYDIMMQCWSENMNERPYFNELAGMLEAIIKSKTVISNNLATFERLQSCSDETDYLVPKSPIKKKKGSLDTMLGLASLPLPRTPQRKRSAADVLISFPPMEDPVENSKCNNNNSTKLKDSLSPICENRYVDLTPSDRNDIINIEDNESEDTRC